MTTPPTDIEGLIDQLLRASNDSAHLMNTCEDADDRSTYALLHADLDSALARAIEIFNRVPWG